MSWPFSCLVILSETVLLKMYKHPKFLHNLMLIDKRFYFFIVKVHLTFTVKITWTNLILNDLKYIDIE